MVTFSDEHQGPVRLRRLQRFADVRRFVACQLVDFCNVKGLYEHSLSMNTSKEYRLRLRAKPATSTPQAANLNDDAGRC
eukprot:13759394-Alexandrium_andersonii.AAC.1